ncbi:hypothetical protein JDV02_006881 [Purpureocillium takamizusanense]|nr:uncharacterized protein JDV02_006881 [Purpureocillium takamizusanense]UNI20831.1 hypothetical protein JDV02_006881 [Purpureocillium takamizusanense]
MVWKTSAAVARFELATFNLIDELVAKFDIPCDWKVVGGMHAIFEQDALDAAKTQIRRLQKHEDLRDKAVLILDKEELAAQRIPEALGAVYQPKAAKCWPYKLVAWLLERLLEENPSSPSAFNLQTSTPVEHLQRSGSSWIVHTRRGQVCAREVLLASNAYTSYLLPKMTGLIVPVRGQVSALEPPPGTAQLAHSYVWLQDSDVYLVHRGPEDTQVRDGEQAGPHPARARRVVDRSLVVGGHRLAAPGREEGLSRDDTVNPILSQALRKSLAHTVKLLPEDQDDPEKLRAAYEWTGIMGYSRDHMPWVGRVPASLTSSSSSSGVVGTDDVEKGLWISAGYTGHGMPVAARCGVAVAEMILGKEGGVQVPRGWMASARRAERARGLELPKTRADMLDMLLVE